MGGYRIDTFQCAAHLSIEQTAHSYAVAEQLSATSFCISCVKYLWDSVGHFLGRWVPAQQGPLAGPFGCLRVIKGGCTRSLSEMSS
ncbi:hypothetical protein BJ917_0462 [Pseudomonas sp. WPR_5_2]|nr:hypothetical protein BJ917_0462 [Pseudomonas sp. WPR_5_2]